MFLHSLSSEANLKSDVLPFRMLSHARDLCNWTKFIDIDFPQLMEKKCKTIRKKANFFDLLDRIREPMDSSLVKLRSDQYVAIGCDLADIKALKMVVEAECDMRSAFFVISEVSTTYMEPVVADRLLEWAAALGQGRKGLFLRCSTLSMQ